MIPVVYSCFVIEQKKSREIIPLFFLTFGMTKHWYIADTFLHPSRILIQFVIAVKATIETCHFHI